LSGSRARRLLGFGGVLVVAWLVVLLMSRLSGTPSGEGATAPATSAGSSQDTTSASSLPSMPPVSVETALPPFGGLVLDGPIQGSALTTRDAAAARGAWTVAVRRDDGSLGHNGAVVTYPVDPAQQGLGTPVQVGSAQGFGRGGWSAALSCASLPSTRPYPKGPRGHSARHDLLLVPHGEQRREEGVGVDDRCAVVAVLAASRT